MTNNEINSDRIEQLLQILDAEVRAGRNADQALAAVDEASDLTPFENVDLAALLSEMVALKAEIRQENQAVRLLRDDSQQSAVALCRALDQAETRYQTAARKLDDSQNQAQLKSAKILVDLIDRLEPTLAAIRDLTRSKPRRFWWSTKPNPRLESLAEGLAITLRHISETLRNDGIARIETLNRSFDPLVMEAVGAEQSNERRDGTVIREIVSGYRHSGRTLRPAQVIVTRSFSEDHTTSDREHNPKKD